MTAPQDAPTDVMPRIEPAAEDPRDRRARHAATAVSGINGLVVLGLVVLAFVISYGAIRDTWTDLGAGTAAAGDIIPIVIEGFIVVASLSAVVRALRGDSTVYPWLLVAAASVVSVAANVAHADDRLGAQVLAAVPPLALLAGVHLIVRDLRRVLERGRPAAVPQRARWSLRRQDARDLPPPPHREVPAPPRETSPPVAIHNHIHTSAQAAALTTPPTDREAGEEVTGETEEDPPTVTTPHRETTPDVLTASPPRREVSPPRREITTPPIPAYSSVEEAWEEIVVRQGGTLGWRRAVTLTGVSEYQAKRAVGALRRRGEVRTS